MLRTERPGDEAAIHDLTTRAFAGTPHSAGTEADIVDRLRKDDALTLSLVDEADGALIGHVAFSPVRIEGFAGWYGLGPVSVAPEHQGKGIGHAMIVAGLAWLRASAAKGCVVLGDPAYYARFGFTHDPALAYPGPPPSYFQRIVFDDPTPSGVVAYHPAFG